MGRPRDAWSFVSDKNAAVADPAGNLMTRQSYATPPVHEVVTDVQFHEDIAEPQLLDLPDRLRDMYGATQRVERSEIELRTGPAGTQTVQTKSTFGFWRFDKQTKDTKWVLRTRPGAFILNAVRSEKWPSGPYVGWEAIHERFEQLLDLLSVAYGNSRPKRVGLRYVNRVAIPQESSPQTWLAVGLRAPDILEGPHSFNLRQTWASIRDHEHLSATIGVARIEIEDEQIAKSHHGILLDIEVFNLKVVRAPAYNELSDWFVEAHKVENKLFEACITDELRTTFG